MKSLFAALSLFTVVLVANNSFGQSTAVDAIAGKVSDPSGALIPGAIIVALNADTGVESRVMSNDKGEFHFPSLPQGRYSVTALLQGFRPATVKDISADGKSTRTVDFKLEIGPRIYQMTAPAFPTPQKLDDPMVIRPSQGIYR